MSVITYNNVTLPYNYTTRFDEAAEYDESNTDRCYTRIEINTQCIISPSYIDIMAPDLAGRGLTLAEIARVVLDRLRRPRKDLSVMFNGKQLIPGKQRGAPGGVDAANGPQTTAEILELNDQTFYINFTVVGRYWENYNTNVNDPGLGFAPNDPGNNVLYNRWEETMEYDEANFTRRTRNGKFKIRSDNVDGKIAAEIMSKMCVVGVPLGFLRKSSRYTVSPDGLSIAYTIVDEEQFKLPPDPAYVADGYYLESSTRADAKRFGEVRVMLKGTKTTPQERLVEAAFSVAANKLFYVGAPIGGAPIGGGAVPENKRSIVQYAGIKVNLYKNEVECNIRVQFASGKKRLKGIAAMRENLVFTPKSDGVDVSVKQYPLRGTAGRLLQAAAYYDPSFTTTQLNEFTGQLSLGKEVGRVGKNPE